jgi:hypothetical protein
MKNLQDLIQVSIGKELPKNYDMTDYVISNLKYQKVCQILEDNEFECYVSSKINNKITQDIYTCTKGKFSGEVVDIYYNYVNDEVYEIAYSSQFNTGEFGTEPKIMNYIK